MDDEGPGFYSRRSRSEEGGGRWPSVDGVADDLKAMRTVLRAALRRQPGDAGPVVRSMESIVRTLAAEARVLGPDRERLSANLRAVLDSLGDEILPANPWGSQK